MRKYTLASPTAKVCIDLRDYQNVIEDAVHQILPNATVSVEQNFYYVTPDPTPSEARSVGRLICKSPLKEHCIQIPKLFSSILIEPKEECIDDGKSKKRMGGHQ